MNNADQRKYAPATERNREPILAVLKQVLPPSGDVLEIASGSGQHAVYLAPQLQPRRWLPSDPNPRARDSIQAWIAYQPAENLLPPLDLDVADPAWSQRAVAAASAGADATVPTARAVPGAALHITAIVNINMIHISPWECCLGLLAGAERILPPEGVLYLYGPFWQQGRPAAPSNEAFDQYLRSQNSAWGIRSLEAVAEAAAQHQLSLAKVFEMPANNLSIVFKRE
ncbi:MAG TPA: DUF938 domain-containing protein [Trichocoleus sp.]